VKNEAAPYGALGVPLRVAVTSATGFRLVHEGTRFVEPDLELAKGIGVDGGDVQGRPALAHDTSANCQLGRAERSSPLAR